jgi:hypothetical protein
MTRSAVRSRSAPPFRPSKRLPGSRDCASISPQGGCPLGTLALPNASEQAPLRSLPSGNLQRPARHCTSFQLANHSQQQYANDLQVQVETILDSGGLFSGWRSSRGDASLSDVHRSIAVRQKSSTWRRAAAFLGPGYLVAVGYMDPGNWATSLAGGSKFGYTLLVIALVSNIMAIILQSLCARLGIATGRDLAQACRDAFPPPCGLGVVAVR